MACVSAIMDITVGALTKIRQLISTRYELFEVSFLR